MRTKRNLALCLLALLGLMATITACGGSDSNEAEATPEPTSEVTCFEQMTSEQRTQLIEYTDQLPESEKANPDGTTDVCVYEKQPDGSYTERHYKQDDAFGDYLLYSMMFGRSNALLGYGVISGDLDVGDAMMLSLLMGNDPTYGMYRPYSYDVDRGYYRQPTYYASTVNNIQYGSAPPVKYDGKSRPAPPAGYQKTKPVPAKSDKVATASKDASGKKSSVKEASGVKASDVINGKAQPPSKTPTSVKPNAPATTIKNPSKPPSGGSSGGGSSGGNTKTTTKSGGSSGGGAKPTPPKPKPPSGGTKRK